jgi:nucleotide-binding universal stress UspA family protein
MTTFKHVLVPTDFGESANRALDLAIDIASQSDAKVTILHVWVMPSVYAMYGQGIAWPVEDVLHEAQTMLDNTLDRVKARYANTDATLTSGEPWSTILSAVADNDVDLVVMGTHGRRGLSHVFLGSVAEKVVRLSPVPVLTVSAESEKKAKAKSKSPAQPTGAPKR